MPVTIRFLSGKTREFGSATGAFRRGGLLIVVDNNQESKFDAADIVDATVTDDKGATIETVPGRSQSE
jgi:hypothetical protein